MKWIVGTGIQAGGGGAGGGDNGVVITHIPINCAIKLGATLAHNFGK